MSDGLKEEGKIIDASANCFPATLWKLLSIRGRSNAEKIGHFNCGSCKEWFSIGDAPTDRVTWTCPWCGKKQKFNAILPEDINGIDVDN